MELKEKAIKSIKWATISTIVGSAIQIVQLLVLSRLLEPKDFGLIAVINVIIVFVRSFADLGVAAAIIHHQDTTERQLSTLYWLNLITGAGLFVIILLFRPFMEFFFKEPVLKDLLLYVSISLLIAPVGSLFQVLFQKELKFNLLAKQEIIATVFGSAVTITSAFLKQGAWALVWGQLANISVRTFLVTLVGLREFRIKLYFNIQEIRGYLNFGLFQIGERSINFLGERIDQLLIGSLLGINVLGYYNFAFNLVSQPVTLLNPIFTRVAFPVLAKVQNDRAMLGKVYLKLLKIISLINSAFLLGLIAVSPFAITLIFGSKWQNSIILIQILSVVALLRSIGNPMGSLILAKGRADIGFKWNLFLLIVTIPLVYIAGKIGSATGIAIALVVLQVVLFYPSYKIMVEAFIGNCIRAYMESILKPFFIGATMCFILLSFVFLKNICPAFLLLGMQMLLGAGIYFFLIWYFDKSTLSEIKSMLFSK